jgi:hypothetical protein
MLRSSRLLGETQNQQQRQLSSGSYEARSKKRTLPWALERLAMRSFLSGSVFVIFHCRAESPAFQDTEQAVRTFSSRAYQNLMMSIPPNVLSSSNVEVRIHAVASDVAPFVEICLTYHLKGVDSGFCAILGSAAHEADPKFGLIQKK